MLFSLFEKHYKFSVCNKYANNENIDIYNYLINKIPYFINKILNLWGVNIKLRTNNSLENFNRSLHNINIKNNMDLITYVDNLINLSIEQINFF